MRFSGWRERRLNRFATILIVAAISLAAGVAWVFGSRTSDRASTPRAEVAEAGKRDPIPLVKRSAAATPPAPTARKGDRCDEGQITLNEGIPAPPPSDMAAAQSALSKLAAQFAAAADPKDRALGLFEQRFNFSASKNEAACNDEQCLQEAEEAGERTARPYTDALAQLASTSNRPDVYVLAFYACNAANSVPGQGGCALVSAAQWARIEPDNALAWIYAADEAAKRGDQAGRDDAYFRASKASTLDSHWALFADQLQTDAAKSLAPDVQAAIGMEVLGALAAIPVPGYLGLVRTYCSGSASSEPNRRQVCSDLAELMTNHPDSAISLSIGIKLGERVGWSSERLAAPRERRDAISQLSSELGSGQTQWCPTIAKWQGSVLDTMRVGEVGLSQWVIDLSGRSVKQLADAWRATHKNEH
jgi:hypothetical protein